jgi:Spy/CpxP family protein refolding chaperone
MPRRTPLILLTVVLLSMPAAAQEKPRDPIGEHLFSPEMILHFQEQIGLTEQQRSSVQKAVEKLQADVQPLQTAMESAISGVSEKLEQSSIDQQAALEQLDRFLELEVQVKRRHVQMLIQVYNELTPEQREQLTDLRPAAEEVRATYQRLEEKVARIEAAAQKSAEAGNPPLAVIEMMQKFPELMKAGQLTEAETLVDEALEQLGE